jgi:hypothetical protein
MRYPRILNLHARDPRTKKVTSRLARLWMLALQDARWVAEEKLDGINVQLRLFSTPVRVEGSVAGRGKNTVLPVPVEEELAKLLGVCPGRLQAGPDEVLEGRELELGEEMVLFFEAVGWKIQNPMGGRYCPDGNVELVLLDGQRTSQADWLPPEELDLLAGRLGVARPPVFGTCTLPEAEGWVRKGLLSKASKVPGVMAEGLVLRPLVELRASHERVICKIKPKNLPAQG